MEKLLNTLNRNQKLAVEHMDGPCLVLAGPGSGKTRVIAHRIINMIHNCHIPPTRILAISFTKSSSEDMKKRTIALGRDERTKKVNFGTFHSSFFRILRKYNDVKLEDIISENDRYKLMKIVLRQLKITNNSDDDIQSLLSEISYVKNELMNPKMYESEIFEGDIFEKVFDNYEHAKNSLNKIDFDDMLIMTYNLLLANEEVLNIVKSVYKYILIDEFQDINKVQFEVIKLIANPENNLFVVGDEDQSIYGFRGARPDFMMDFSKHFENAKIITLEKNYRSNPNIIDISQKLIKNNKNRYNKKISAYRSGKGDIKYLFPKDVEEEAREIAKLIKKSVESEKQKYIDIAVIYRTNKQSRAFIDAFLDERIPFIIRDSMRSIYEHWVGLDIISYLKIAVNSATNEDWARVINKPFRYISKDAVKKAVDSPDFFDSLIKNEDIKQFQKKDLEDLFVDLNYIKSLAPEYAISYIRTTLDYDRYILDYCHERKIKATHIVEILNEIESSSKGFKTIFEFFKHIENINIEIRKRNEENRRNGIEEFSVEGVTLSTMHSSKGLEFNTVYIAGINEGTVPYYSSNDELESGVDIEEERRLFYVGISRAKDNLILSIPARKYNKKAEMSRFLKEIEKNK